MTLERPARRNFQELLAVAAELLTQNEGIPLAPSDSFPELGAAGVSPERSNPPAWPGTAA